MLRNLLASRAGQLAFDFRIEAQPAKVLQLKRREPPPLAALMDAPPVRGDVVGRAATSSGASMLDDGDPAELRRGVDAPTGGRSRSIPTWCRR